jgi:hypothetical protein
MYVSSGVPGQPGAGQQAAKRSATKTVSYAEKAADFCLERHRRAKLAPNARVANERLRGVGEQGRV